jgi:hypothetical protein
MFFTIVQGFGDVEDIADVVTTDEVAVNAVGEESTEEVEPRATVDKTEVDLDWEVEASCKVDEIDNEPGMEVEWVFELEGMVEDMQPEGRGFFM